MAEEPQEAQRSIKPNDGTVTGSISEWFGRMRPVYEGLSDIARSMIESLLREQQIDYLSVTSRAKTIKSLEDKLKKKTYGKASDIHDYSGIRVVVFIESDVEKVSALIHSSFNVHQDKSLDKSAELGVDRMGYRSRHLVCDLGKNRESLPEYSAYRGMLFEVQTRTVLQHAWAEIEHDRQYKLSGVLPAHLQRRLHLAAGTLEMVDREFDAIARAIDEYSQVVREKTRGGDLEIEIDSTSVRTYLEQLSVPRRVELGYLDKVDTVFDELRNFGIRTLADLAAILSPAFLGAVAANDSYRSTDVGFLRDAMMYADIKKYFAECWNRNWDGMDLDALDLLISKYGETPAREVLARYGVEIVPT